RGPRAAPARGSRRPRAAGGCHAVFQRLEARQRARGATADEPSGRGLATRAAHAARLDESGPGRKCHEFTPLMVPLSPGRVARREWFGKSASSAFYRIRTALRTKSAKKKWDNAGPSGTAALGAGSYREVRRRHDFPTVLLNRPVRAPLT